MLAYLLKLLQRLRILILTVNREGVLERCYFLIVAGVYVGNVIRVSTSDYHVLCDAYYFQIILAFFLQKKYQCNYV